MVGLDFGTAFVTNDVVASLDDKEENSQKGDENNYSTQISVFIFYLLIKAYSFVQVMKIM